MKFNKAIILLISLALVASVGIVVAEDVTVNPYTFTVPDGYTVVQSDDTICAMQKDEFNAISFATDVTDDLESAKQSLIDQGKTFINEQEINYNDNNITLQVFSADVNGNTLYVYNYVMLSDDGNFVVSYSTNDAEFDGDLNTEGNPVSTIFDTIAVN